MIPSNQWKLDMTDGIAAASRRVWFVFEDAQALRASIQAPLREDLMNKDTAERTGGKCPIVRGYLQRQYKALAEACAKCWNPKPKTGTE